MLTGATTVGSRGFPSSNYGRRFLTAGERIVAGIYPSNSKYFCFSHPDFALYFDDENETGLQSYRNTGGNFHYWSFRLHRVRFSFVGAGESASRGDEGGSKANCARRYVGR